MQRPQRFSVKSYQILCALCAYGFGAGASAGCLRRLLHKTVVDENGPGTVLHDFEAFLALVEEEELPLTGTHQLPRRVLPELNSRLARPLQIGLTRPLQKSYPHVHGLYLLLRASGLTIRA